MKPLATLFRTAFTRLSFPKRWLVRLSVLGLVFGLGVKGYAMVQETGPSTGIDWSSFSLTSGLGYLGGFLVGAAVRVFFKLSLFVSLVLAGIGYGLSHFGLIDLPWDSFSEAAAAFGGAVERQTAAVQDFLSGYLPAGAATAMGLASGVTQKPEFDED